MSGRSAVSARFALAALSLVAAWSLARCFVGPGVAVPAVAAVLVAEITILGAAALSGRRRFAPPLLAVLGLALVLLVPIWIVAGSATTWGWPTFATWHVIGRDLERSWTVFNQLRAPVPEMPGFTLVGAWAVGGAALLAGWAADGGDTPLWVVAPPAAVFFFTAALGTPQWRALAIALEVAALAWYAASARAARREQTVAFASPTGAPAPAAARRRSFRGAGVALPAAVVIVVAAVLAAALGPRLPGAVSPPLVSLRGSGTDGNLPSTNSGNVVPPPVGQIGVSTLVQVAQEEIYQPRANFFSVKTSAPQYMILTTLNSFDGDRWLSSSAFVPDEVVGLPGVTGVSGAEKTAGGTESLLETQISIDRLGDSFVPAPEVPQMIDGSRGVTYDQTTDTLQATGSLRDGMSFDIVSELPTALPSTAPATPGALSASLTEDVSLPSGIPASIVRLAHQIVKGKSTDYEKALALQNYFLTGAFRYSLPGPGTASNPAVTGGEGLQDLKTFLFDTRSGFCQQYASAFGVLARIDGLPTRIAVGFVPGSPTATGYVVTGTDLHAWPQVYLGGAFGWWSFEPTPGSAIPTPPFQVSPPSSQTNGNPSAANHGRAPNFARAPSSISGSGAFPHKTPPVTATGSGSGSGLSWTTIFEVLLLLIVLVLCLAPAARLIRRRRARSNAARVVNAWREATSALGVVGLQERPGETFSELAARVSTTGALPDRANEQLVRLARHTTVAAYAPTAPPPETVQEAISASREICSAARRRAGPWRSTWSMVTPRGLIDSRGS